MDDGALMAAVDAAFSATRGDLADWVSPHAHLDEIPQDAYSRITDPARYRLLGARADAWRDAVVALGLASVEHGAPWPESSACWPSRIERLVPSVIDGLTVTFGHHVSDDGLSFVHAAVGDEPVELLALPNCGCDACDEGSEAGLERIDDLARAVVTGRFRRIDDGDRSIQTTGGPGWSASGKFPRSGSPGRWMSRMQAMLDEPPDGWRLLAGSAWSA